MNAAAAHVPPDSPPGPPQGALPPRPDPLHVRLREAPVTAIVLATCIVLYAITFAATLLVAESPWDTALRSLWSLDPTESTDILRRFGVLELSRVWLDGEWWRLLTTSLLHGSLLHLVLNGTALLSVGEWLEHAWGRLRTLSLFIVAGFGGSLASLAWCESRVVLGASAGILGQAGALCLARRFGPPDLQAKLAPVSALGLAILIVVCLLLGLVIPGLAQAGHLGGLAAGLLLGAAWIARPLAVRLVLSSSLTLGLAALTWYASAPTDRMEYDLIRGLRKLADGDIDESLNLFKGALAKDNSASLRNNIAYELAQKGEKLDFAEQLALEAVAKEPLNPSYLDTLAWAWCRQGIVESSIRVLHAAAWLERDPFPELEEHLAQCATVSRETPPVPAPQ